MIARRYSYLATRKDQLKYAEAIAEGLPIGSGEIESAHRYVAQKRLKLPGAWWLVAGGWWLVAGRARGTHARATNQPPER